MSNDIGKAKNLIDQTFGTLKVIKRYYGNEDEKKYKERTHWECECTCGNMKVLSGGKLSKQKTCGRDHYIWNTTDKYGRLRIIEKLDRKDINGQWFLCECDCGGKKEVPFGRLRQGHTQSCGCKIAEAYADKIIDLTGTIQGNLTVLKRDDAINDVVSWLCQCRCGNVISHMKSNMPDTCGKCSKIGNEIVSLTSYNTSAIAIYQGYCDGDISFTDFLLLSQSKCFYCHILPFSTHNTYIDRKDMSKEFVNSAVFTYNGLDRVDSSKPHTLSNSIPCCMDCNYAKKNMTMREFYIYTRALRDSMIPHLEKMSINDFKLLLLKRTRGSI